VTDGAKSALSEIGTPCIIVLDPSLHKTGAKISWMNVVCAMATEEDGLIQPSK
jgi:hypothetical protein